MVSELQTLLKAAHRNSKSEVNICTVSFFTNSELKFLYKALGWKTNMAQWQTDTKKGQYMPVGLQTCVPCTAGQSPAFRAKQKMKLSMKELLPELDKAEKKVTKSKAQKFLFVLVKIN